MSPEFWDHAGNVIGWTMLLAASEAIRYWRDRARHRHSPIEQITAKHVAIQGLLAEVGTRYGADRTYLTMISNGEWYIDGSELQKFRRSLEWCRVGVSSEKDRWREVPISWVPEEAKLVIEPGASYRRVEELHDGEFRRLLACGDVYAFTRQTVTRRGNKIGYLGLDFCTRKTEPPDIADLAAYAGRIEQILSGYR